MKKLSVLISFFLLTAGMLSAQSGYVYPTNDLQIESIKLFDKLNISRIDGGLFVGLLSTSTNEAALPKKMMGHFVYVDAATGKQKFKGEYDVAYPFNGQLALVVSEGKRGVINQSGRWVVKPTDPMFNQLEEKGMYLNARSGKFEYIIYEDQAVFSYKPYKQNGKWGIISNDPAKPLVPYEYDGIIAIDMNGFIALKNQRLGYVRLKDNKPLCDFEYVRLAYSNSDYGFNDLYHFALYDMENEVWDYYTSDYNGLTKLFSANHYGFNYKMGEFCVAKFRIGEEYNVFFKDGSTLPNSYKWIMDTPSKQLILAIDKENRIVIVNKHGDEFVVCE